MKTIPGFVWCILLTGCAGVSGADCQTSDWRQLGERDGVLGAQSQHERYAASCGSAFQAEPYREGFREGFGRRPRPVV